MANPTENPEGNTKAGFAGLLAYNKKPNTTYIRKGQFRTVFCAETENVATLAAHQMAQDVRSAGGEAGGKFAGGITAQFNEAINGVCYGLCPAWLESANAVIL